MMNAQDQHGMQNVSRGNNPYFVVLCSALDRLPTPNILNKVKVKAVNVLRVFASVFSVTYCITV
jgi:hypothetical protein